MDYTLCCHGYSLTSIMMGWIIQIGLFSLLSLRQLIYAWVPRGRLQLSFLCLNLSLPVPGNKPAMIINQRRDFFSTKIEIQIMPICCSTVACYVFFFSYSTCITDQELKQTPWLSLQCWSWWNLSLNTYITILFSLFFPILNFMHIFYFQRTRFHMVSPLLIWAPSWRWLKRPALPPCCVPPVETQTQRSPGSKTCFLWTSVTATGALNSSAQVQFDGNVFQFCYDLIWTVSQVTQKPRQSCLCIRERD